MYCFYLTTGPIKKQWDNMTTKRPSGVNLCRTGQNPPSRNVLELRILLWSWQKKSNNQKNKYFQNQSIYICWYICKYRRHWECLSTYSGVSNILIITHCTLLILRKILPFVFISLVLSSRGGNLNKNCIKVSPDDAKICWIC